MQRGVMAAAPVRGRRVDLDAIETRVQLRERGRGVGAEALPRLDRPERRRFLERIDVDDSDRRPVARPADGRNPWDIAIDDENEIGFLESAVLERMVPVVALIERIGVGKVDGARNRFQHASAKPAAKADELGYGGGITPDIGGDDERARRFLNGGDEIRDGGFGQGHGRGRRPVGDVARDALGFRLHDFARADEIDGPLGIAMGDLQRSVHDLLDVVGAAKLVVVFHVLADDAALVGDVLNPLNEFVAAARRFALLGGRR